jgi:hydroxymethylglutaryl-CoA reductase
MSAVNRKFRKLELASRLLELKNAGVISDSDYQKWLAGEYILDNAKASHMIENVVGVFGLPQGIAINFPVNGTLYQVPLVVEEPSIVAALSFAALTAEKNGGFQASADTPLIYGQIQLIQLADLSQAKQVIEREAPNILALANTFMPSMAARGGGAVALRVRELASPNLDTTMLVVDISFDTKDAMGANAVNSVCEAVAPKLEELSGGRALLKILSNLADQALARAQVRIKPSSLSTKTMAGDELRDRIVLANEFALADPYRAATHNKGIMNGIDPVAVATGNDWRSIEAAAHAYAARDGQYRALTHWRVNEDAELVGSIELPIKVGTVGGSLQSNPAVKANLRMLGISDAPTLAGLMAAVGLAQNFSALRALVSDGIQQGHMSLHARSVALSAEVPDALFEQVVKRMIDEGDIKVSRAKSLTAELAGNA